MTEAVQGMLDKRLQRPDLAVVQKDVLDKLSKKEGLGFTAAISQDGLSIDPEKSINTMPTDAAGQRDARISKFLKEFVAGVDTKTVAVNAEVRNAISHNRMKVYLGNVISDLKSDVGTCGSPPKARRWIQTGAEEPPVPRQVRGCSLRTRYRSLSG